MSDVHSAVTHDSLELTPEPDGLSALSTLQRVYNTVRVRSYPLKPGES